MKISCKEPAAAEKQTATDTSGDALSRRKFITASVAVGAMILTEPLYAATKENRMKNTFTILHTNDMHSAFIGMGPAADYTPFTLNDDATRGGFARLASMIALRRKTRGVDGPVLMLDAGDLQHGNCVRRRHSRDG